MVQSTEAGEEKALVSMNKANKQKDTTALMHAGQSFSFLLCTEQKCSDSPFVPTTPPPPHLPPPPPPPPPPFFRTSKAKGVLGSSMSF